MDLPRERLATFAALVLELRDVSDVQLRLSRVGGDVAPFRALLQRLLTSAGRDSPEALKRGKQLLLVDRHPVYEYLVDKGQVDMLVWEDLDQPVDHRSQVGVEQLQELLRLDHE